VWGERAKTTGKKKRAGGKEIFFGRKPSPKAGTKMSGRGEGGRPRQGLKTFSPGESGRKRLAPETMCFLTVEKTNGDPRGGLNGEIEDPPKSKISSAKRAGTQGGGGGEKKDIPRCVETGKKNTLPTIKGGATEVGIKGPKFSARERAL